MVLSQYFVQINVQIDGSFLLMAFNNNFAFF